MRRRECMAILGAGIVSAEPLVRETLYSRPVLLPNEVVPLYDNGHLVYVHPPDKLTILRPGGVPAADIQFGLTGDGPCSVSSFAVNAEGHLAVGLSRRTATGWKSAIRWLDAKGTRLREIDAGEHVPALFCFDAAGHLWSIGPERRNGEVDHRYEHSLVRKYSQTGAETGRFISRSLWPAPKSQPGRFARGYWRMRAAADRVGALIHENHADNPAEWIEWDLNGNLLSRTLLSDDLTGQGRAYTADARLYAQFRVKPGPKKELRVLDTRSGSWTPVPDNLPDHRDTWRVFLLGAEGNDLVYSLSDRLLRVAPGA